MALYTIGDLHLSLAGDKPMDKFGESWKNHRRVLEESPGKTEGGLFDPGRG